MCGEKAIRVNLMECPLCGKMHEVSEYRRVAKIMIKDEETQYDEIYYRCNNYRDDENEFISGKMMNENLLRARNAYRVKHGLLTSDEIIDFRERYGMSQVDLARILDWGEATVSRYESKAIQDEAYDNMLRLVRDNPYKMIEYLDDARDKIDATKYRTIRSKIEDDIELYGREKLSRQSLESEYVKYSEKTVNNGYTILNIDKIESMINYFAIKTDVLYKVKLMKLLWYADVISYINSRKTMTGLVYQHDSYGALPIGHYRIMGLENVKFEEIELENSSGYTAQHIMPNDAVDMTCLSKSELEILDLVVNKFGLFTGTELKQYMHEEKAYKDTSMYEIIDFDIASEIRPFWK